MNSILMDICVWYLRRKHKNYIEGVQAFVSRLEAAEWYAVG
jgi:hypothetical protein